ARYAVSVVTAPLSKSWPHNSLGLSYGGVTSASSPIVVFVEFDHPRLLDGVRLGRLGADLGSLGRVRLRVRVGDVHVRLRLGERDRNVQSAVRHRPYSSGRSTQAMPPLRVWTPLISRFASRVPDARFGNPGARGTVDDRRT